MTGPRSSWVNRQGFSLVQVLVGMGLVAMLSMFYGQVNIFGMKSQNNLLLTSDFNSIVNLVGLALQNTAVCNANLNTTNLSSLTFNATAATLSSQTIPVTRLTYPNGSVIIQNGALPTGLVISELKLHQFQELSPGSSYLAMLHLRATKPQGRFLGAGVLERDLPVVFNTHYTAAPTAILDSCGNQPGIHSNQLAKAWVNFDGLNASCNGLDTDTGLSNKCPIRSAYNISKVIRRSTGRYTAYFTNPMADANYVISGSATNANNTFSADSANGNPTTTYFYMAANDNSNNFEQAPQMHAVIYGN